MNKNDAYNLRLIEKSDNPQVASIIRTVMTALGASGPGYAINDPHVDYMYGAYQVPGAKYFVIESENKVFGCGGISKLKGAQENICELQKMYFLPELRGKGWGRRMLETCLSEARNLGYEKCYLETLSSFKIAKALYEKFGFSQLDAPLGNTGHYSADEWYLLDL